MITAKELYQIRKGLISRFDQIEEFEKMLADIRFAQVSDKFNKITIDGVEYDGMSFFEIQEIQNKIAERIVSRINDEFLELEKLIK